MTYRYYKIRREIFEDNSEKPLKKFRSGSDLKELFKPFHWTVLVLTIVSFIAFIVMSIFVVNKLWCIFPLLIIILLTDLWDYKAEKFYNKDARKKELMSIDCDYENYLKSIYEILHNNGIESEKELNILIDECSKMLEKRDNRFQFIKSKAYEIFLGIPIGALITSLINQNSEKIPVQIVTALLLGLLIYPIFSLVKFVSNYADGYQKDQSLLKALNEMKYYFLSVK